MGSDAYHTIAAATQNLNATSERVEGRFVEIGDQLAPAIGILERITAIFEKLGARLAGDDLTRATANLTEAATEVSGLADSLKGQKSAIGDLTKAIAAMTGNIARMRQTITFVAVLAQNGRIQAAALDKAAIDFSVFTKDVDRITKLAGDSLDGLDHDLTHLDAQLQVAIKSHDEFDRHQAAAIANIPKWLGESVEAAAAHGRLAAKAATNVRERSQDVAQKVGATVMALQIGDATRQRVEHVTTALQLLSPLLGGGTEGNAAIEESWRGLQDEERNYLIVEICRLEAAQLLHAAQDFERDVAQIIAALKGLADDAREILRLSKEAYGASDQRRATFLVELEENVGRALGLIKGVKTARDQNNHVATSVLDAVMRSADHIETVRTLEVDLRLLGLNMTFKCDRLGYSGRALSTIAQQLRGCADQTTEDAQIVMSGLDGITKIADRLEGNNASAKSDEIGAVETIMTESVGHYGEAGQHIAKALAALAEDGEAVAALLAKTAARIDFQGEIANALKEASRALETVAAHRGRAVEPTPAALRAKDVALAQLLCRYTMASERAIHREICGSAAAEERGGAGAAPAMPAAEAMLDDVLF